MPAALILLALLLGAFADVTFAGRVFVLSYIDVVALGVAVAGLVTAWRRRQLRVDAVVAAYGAILLVVLVQVATLGDAARILGGASRFAVPLMIVVGGSQLVRARDGIRPAAGLRRSAGWTPEPWDWPALVSLFGAVLAITIFWDLVPAAIDRDGQSFYDIKNQLVVPLGASNYLAAFLMLPAAAGLAFGRPRPIVFGMGVVSAIGLVATLSRSAYVAAAGAVAVGLALLAAGRLWTGNRRHAALVVPVALYFSQVGAVQVGSTGLQRMELWELAWESFLQRPFLGVGLNRFGTLTTDLAQPHVNAHNLELHALATLGIVGALAYGVLWVVLGLRVWRLPAGPTRIALAVGFGAMFLHAQLEALAFTRAFEALLALGFVIAGAGENAFAVRDVRLGDSPEAGVQRTGH